MPDVSQRLLHQWGPSADQIGSFGASLPSHRAERDAPIELADLSQLGDAPEVNEHLRSRQSQVEHRHQALAPGKHHAVVGILRTERKRLIERRRRPVVKQRRFHLRSGGVDDREHTKPSVKRIRLP